MFSPTSAESVGRRLCPGAQTLPLIRFVAHQGGARLRRDSLWICNLQDSAPGQQRRAARPHLLLRILPCQGRVSWPRRPRGIFCHPRRLCSGCRTGPARHKGVLNVLQAIIIAEASAQSSVEFTSVDTILNYVPDFHATFLNLKNESTPLVKI
jgi:hypothetical protein